MKKKIYHSYRGKLTTPEKKKEMLDKVRQNKEKIGEVIRSIKLSNKLIRKFAKKIEKFVGKIREKSSSLKTTGIQVRRYQT